MNVVNTGTPLIISLLISTMMFFGVYVLYDTGILFSLIEDDKYYILAVIAVVFYACIVSITSKFFFCHFWKLPMNTDFERFSSEALVTLGLFGSIVGFGVLFSDNFVSTNITDHQSVIAIFANFTTGIKTAIMTTLGGIVTSLILQVHLLLVNYFGIGD